MENKNLTAMQSFISDLKACGVDSCHPIVNTTVELIINLAESKLEMEKEQIVEAAMWMPKPFENMEFLPELGQQYYNETYKK